MQSKLVEGDYNGYTGTPRNCKLIPETHPNVVLFKLRKLCDK